MGEERSTPAIDLIRWTFTIDPARRVEVEMYLNDLGLDVLVRGEGQFLVTWEEPDRDVDEVIEELWAIHGLPFEVTQEEFTRTSLFLVHHEDAEASEAHRGGDSDEAAA